MTAHGSAGGFDELLFVLAAIGIVTGTIRLADRRVPRRKRLVGAPIILAALGAGALPIIVRTGTPRIADARPVSSARLEILSPRAGEEVRGDELEVSFRLIGGRMTDRTTGSLRPDEGHLHVSVDGLVLSSTAGLRRVLRIGDLGPGRHLLQAEFAAVDHGPFSPRVLAVVEFVVVR